ncbi:MAG: ATP-binding cassette domain-containing protein, partial [Dehalococcoidia bacterium]|nr:ATP-binding cassette domain-containing protein [Dehalococcoidia bacterium]
MSGSAARAILLAGDVNLAVHAGEAAVFARVGDGRRIPVATVGEGVTLAAGADITGVTIIVEPMPGSVVAPVTEAWPPFDDLLPWLASLAENATAGRWPLRPVPIEQANLALAPGECVLNDTVDLLWVRATAGSARLCGNPGATVTPAGGPIPLPRGTWLEAELRCRIDPLGDGVDLSPGEVERGIREFTRLAVLGVVDQWNDDQRSRGIRVATETERDHVTIASAVDSLTAAVEPDLADRSVDHLLAPAVGLAHAYGVRPDTAGLRRAQDLLDRGSDPLHAIATVCNMTVRSVRLTEVWAAHEGLPMLIEVADRNGKRVQVVISWHRGWRATDPSTGEGITFDPMALVGTTAHELQPLLPSLPQRLIDLARLGLRGSAFDALFIAAAGVFVALVTFWSPRLLGRLGETLTERMPVGPTAAVFMLLAALAVAAALAQLVQSLALLRVRARAIAVSAVAVWERLIRQSARWHAGHGIGERLVQGTAVNAGAGSIPDQTVIAVLNLISVLGSLGAILTVGARIFMSIAVLLGLQATISLMLLRRSSRHLETSLQAGAIAASRLIEALRAIPRLRVAGAEARAFQWWSEAQSAQLRGAKSMRSTMMAEGVVRAVWPTLVLVVLIVTLWTGSDSLGSFITSQSAATTATTTLATAMAALISFTVARRTIQRVDPVLHATPEATGDGVDPGTINGGFQFQDVRFSYPEGPTVIDGLNLTIRPGDHVAIVGPSGCGKTTLLRLLLGLDAPDSGVITCDGHDMAVLDRTSVRRQIGSVLQSSQLLPGTLRENVAMGRRVTTRQIWAALDAAQVGADVRAMPMGLQTPMTDGGSTLSGGQQQRMLIARALVGEPRALDLDEATSALDYESERAIQQNMKRIAAGRTVFVVAHRLSTVRQADRIIT